MSDSAPITPSFMTYGLLLDRFASLDEVAACLGVPVLTARQYRNRGRVPPAYWDRFQRRAPRYGVTITPGELECAEIAYQAQRARTRVEPEMKLSRARRRA